MDKEEFEINQLLQVQKHSFGKVKQKKEKKRKKTVPFTADCVLTY